MMLALLVLSRIAVVIICIGIITLAFSFFAIRKTSSWMGKINILLSIIVFLACSFFAVTFPVRTQQAELQEVLFRAAIDGNKAKVKDLVAKGANINEVHEGSYTLLHYAIEHGNNRMLEALLEGGANVKIRNAEGLTPMQLLLERSINPWLRNESLDYEAAAKLLLAHGAVFDFQYKGRGEKTCVQNAISNHQIGILKLMLENGADINYKDEKGGYLHHAISEKAKMDVIEILLSAGADPNILDKNGDTALHVAAYFGRRDVVEALLIKGATINTVNNKGMTALSVAKNQRGNFLGNRKEVIELLQQKEKENALQK